MSGMHWNILHSKTGGNMFWTRLQCHCLLLLAIAVIALNALLLVALDGCVIRCIGFSIEVARTLRCNGSDWASQQHLHSGYIVCTVNSMIFVNWLFPFSVCNCDYMYAVA
jgi:hypothetical protein